MQLTKIYNFSVSSGTALNKSATRPWSATWKIGASGSLFIATMVFESFMPAKCWIAPEIPTAIYKSYLKKEYKMIYFLNSFNFEFSIYRK